MSVAPSAATPGAGATSGAMGAGTAWTSPPSSDSGSAWNSGSGLALTAGIWDDGLNYGFFRDYLAAHPQILGDPGFSISDYDASQREFVGRTPRTVLDVALVLDTTGSMGDELSYLTSEFAAISDTIRSRFPNSDQRWALVVYRDTPDTDPGDEYVVRSFEFTSDMTAFRMTLAAQRASGGGDYPESPELGIAQLAQLTWRADPAAARLAFWVADAPHHATNAEAVGPDPGDVLRIAGDASPSGTCFLPEDGGTAQLF